MRVILPVPAEEQIEIDRRAASVSDTPRRLSRIGPDRITFGDLARFASPRKTAAWLAHSAKVDVRTAERWLAGKHEPPIEMLGTVMFEIMRRFNQRE